MPAEKLRCRTLVLTSGNHRKRFSSMPVVLPPVFEFRFESITNLHAQILHHRDMTENIYGDKNEAKY